MYKTEQAFSKQFLQLARAYYRFVLRVESGETSRGFPDVYCVGKYGEQWYELKNCPRLSVKSNSWTIPWRIGQQAWHLKYAMACKKQGKIVLTVVAMKDGFIVIPMDRRYNDNMVYKADVIVCKNLDEVFIC